MNARKNIQMVVTVVLLILAAACTLFKEKLNAPQTFELRMNPTATAASRFYVLNNVDTNTKTLQKHTKNMKDFSVGSISYSVKDVSGNSEAVVSGDIAFAPLGSNEFTVLTTITDLHLRHMEESGQGNRIVLQKSAVRQKLEQLLQAGKPVTFRLNATTANNPVAASLIVSVNTQLTVEI